MFEEDFEPQRGSSKQDMLGFSDKLKSSDNNQMPKKGDRCYSNESDDLFGSSAENNLAFMSTADDFPADSGPEVISKHLDHLIPFKEIDVLDLPVI